jgi:hypothetical protein
LPWDARSFSRHNHGLTPAKAAHAAKIANAVLRRSGDEGMAIATANARVRATGGIVATDGDGGIMARAIGGTMSPSSAPWFTRQQARSSQSGFLHGITPGRADLVKTTAPAGAFVIPADVVAGLGEGNGLAGASTVEKMLRSGPHGIPMPKGGAGRGPPRPPRIGRASGGATYGYVPKGGPWTGPKLFRASGGEAPGPDATPVALSDGEYVVGPHDVIRVGKGDHGRGIKWLEGFVVHHRKKQIERLKKLPGPVKS